MILIVFLLISQLSFSLMNFRGGHLRLKGKALKMFLDKDSSMNFKDILKDNSLFKVLEDGKVFDFKEQSTYWFKISFVNSSSANKLLVVTDFFRYNDFPTEIELFLQLENGKIEKSVLSNQYSISGVKIISDNLCGIVPTRPQKEVVFYLKVSCSKSSSTGKRNRRGYKPYIYISESSAKIIEDYRYKLYKFFFRFVMVIGHIWAILTFFFTFRFYYLYFAIYSLINSFYMQAQISYYFIADFLPFSNFIFMRALNFLQLFFFLALIKNFLERNFSKVAFSLFTKFLVVILFLVNIALTLNLNYSKDYPFIEFSPLSYFILMILYLQFCHFLTKMKHHSAYIFTAACYIAVLVYCLTDFSENIFKFDANFVSFKMTEVYDILTDLLILLALAVDRFYISNMEKLIDKNADNFVYALGSSGDSKEVFENIVLNLKKHFNYDQIYLFSLEGGIHDILFSNISKKNYEKVKSDISDMINEVIGKFTKEDIIFIKSTKGDLNVNYDTIVIPLKVRQENLGYFFLRGTFSRVYNVMQKSLIKNFSNKMALILEHFNKAKALNDRIQLAEIYENIGLFHKTSTHEIKIPLLSLRNSLKRLKHLHGYSGDIDKLKDVKNMEISQHLETIEESLSSSIEQINNSLSMVGAEDSDVFDYKYLKDGLESLRKLCEFLGIEFEEDYLMDEEIKLYGPKNAIKNVVIMVVKNGIEALEKSTDKTKKLSFVLSIVDNRIQFKVVDNAGNLSEEARKNVFKRYTEGKMAGSGQGLMLCRSIVERLGGRILIAFEENIFTKVEFTMDILYKPKDEIL